MMIEPFSALSWDRGSSAFTTMVSCVNVEKKRRLMLMRKANRISLSALIIFSVMIPPVFASGEGTAGDYFYGMGAQLGRGLVNVVSSPAEIPCTMTQDTKDQGASGLATGFGKGTFFMLRRIVIGVSEIGTFILPADRTIPPVCQEKPSATVA